MRGEIRTSFRKPLATSVVVSGISSSSNILDQKYCGKEFEDPALMETRREFAYASALVGVRA